MGEFSMPVTVRYAEIDRQGVVFNGHYLTWFDEAWTALLDHLGAGYPDLIAGGHDVQVVHTEVDYTAPVRWRDTVRVTADCVRVGTTSVTVEFTVLRSAPGVDEHVAVRGRTVYVVVSTADWAKCRVPPVWRAALDGSSPVR